MNKFKLTTFTCYLLSNIFSTKLLVGQNFFPADPNYLLLYEKSQFQGKIPVSSNLIKPFFFNKNNDSLSVYVNYKSEFYLNDNSPNQENMDVRYFTKGYSAFNSLQFSLSSKYLYFILEPYNKIDKFYKTKIYNRYGPFNSLNDFPIYKNQLYNDSHLRNFLFFLNYKGFGIGFHQGNRWWGPGLHSTLQMTNNSWPIPSKIIGTLKEIRIGKFGLMGLYSIANLKDTKNPLKKFYTSLNGQLTWYGNLVLSMGFSRNYLSGGVLSIGGREWTEEDASLLVFEGFLTENLIDKEYTNAGHDQWDQTISGYIVLTYPDKGIKLYAEVGSNDNRMYLADFISQPDHTMATVIGFRDYGIPNSITENFIYGFEWTNLMITYTIRHRGANGTPAWYNRDLYNYSSYNFRRWGAHSGADSDDWFIYFGYLSNKFAIIPSLNYERHGIVSNRPAETKFELNLSFKYNYKNVWFGLKYEKQYEYFLGFPDYFYEDIFGNPVDSSSGKLAKSRITNTLILSMNKYFNF